MVVLKVMLVASLAVLSGCEPPVHGYHYSAPAGGYQPPANSYIPPSAGHAPSSSYLPPNSYSGGYSGDHGQHHETPKSYEFGYSVKDAQSGNDYGRREASDGNEVRGEYRVQLPDGRTQIVTYHADWQSGFHADVRYEGEPVYPQPSHGAHQGYNYNAPSDFSGSLTGFQGSGYSRPSSSYGPPGYH